MLQIFSRISLKINSTETIKCLSYYNNPYIYFMDDLQIKKKWCKDMADITSYTLDESHSSATLKLILLGSIEIKSFFLCLLMYKFAKVNIIVRANLVKGNTS
jgi:hypothetical protein